MEKTNAGKHHEEENPRHKTKQVGMVVGCQNCEYTLFTVMNTEYEKEWEKDKDNFMSSRFSQMMDAMTEEELAWKDRPVVLRKRRIAKNKKMKKKQELAREILNATEKVYPCRVRSGSYDSEFCQKPFESKKELRVHLINDHTEHEVETTVKYYL